MKWNPPPPFLPTTHKQQPQRTTNTRPHTVGNSESNMSQDLIPLSSHKPMERKKGTEVFQARSVPLMAHAAEEWLWQWLWLRKLFVCPWRTGSIHHVQRSTSRASYFDAGWGQFQLSHWVFEKENSHNRKRIESDGISGLRADVYNQHGKLQIKSIREEIFSSKHRRELLLFC